jgi:hypothetical protein
MIRTPPVHHCTPVHSVWFHCRGEREECEHKHREKETQGPNVDCHAESAERPFVWGEGLPPDTLKEHAANRDDVRGHHCADG